LFPSIVERTICCHPFDFAQGRLSATVGMTEKQETRSKSPHAKPAYGAPADKMSGFPAQIAGTPTNRGEARRYEVRRGHDPFGYAQDRLYRAPT